MNCTLTVPANPLTAKGLATPYQLGDGCTMANAANEGAFVEATILEPNGWCRSTTRWSSPPGPPRPWRRSRRRSPAGPR